MLYIIISKYTVFYVAFLLNVISNLCFPCIDAVSVLPLR